MHTALSFTGEKPTRKAMKQSTCKTKNARGNTVKSTQNAKKNLPYIYVINKKTNG